MDGLNKHSSDFTQQGEEHIYEGKHYVKLYLCITTIELTSISMAMGYELDAQGLFPSRARYMLLIHINQTGFGPN